MGVLVGLVRGIEAVNLWVGRVVSLMALGTVLACFATVYLRYALNTNFAWLQEAYLWQHALVIVLGAAYTMMTGGFVRVDILYGKMPPQRRAMVDLVGTAVFLLPFLYVLWAAFTTFFLNSFRVDEGSPNAGGLPNWWLLKLAMLAFIVLTALQGVALMARSLLVLGGREEFAGKATSH
jgi:TRAP-type mannitol/chloroaromatic compound transport system permease small subunit